MPEADRPEHGHPPATRERHAPQREFPRSVLARLKSVLVSKELLLPGLVFVVVLTTWELGVPAAGIESYILPTPTEILTALSTEYPTILDHLAFTLKAFAVAFSLTVVSGYLLALFMSQWAVVETTFYPYVIVARSIPTITLLPIFIIWLGFGFPSIVMISYLISFFAMVVNSLSGFKSTDEELVDMIRSFSASKREVFWNVYAYSSLPAVFAGLKIAVILAFTGVIVGEFLVGTDGIGYLIFEFNNALAVPEMFASVFVISATQLLLFGLVVGLERTVVTWNYGAGPDS
jgi:NitT/TauT family transport system permease protein